MSDVFSNYTPPPPNISNILPPVPPPPIISMWSPGLILVTGPPPAPRHPFSRVKDRARKKSERETLKSKASERQSKIASTNTDQEEFAKLQ